jgi:hypothetical protein
VAEVNNKLLLSVIRNAKTLPSSLRKPSLGETSGAINFEKSIKNEIYALKNQGMVEGTIPGAQELAGNSV